MVHFKLKERILESGLKQVFIARQTLINPVRLSKIIHGHVTASKCEKQVLAKILDTEVAELFTEDR